MLDWLRERALPHELRLADTEHARTLAHDFVQALAANGTTTALVFGAHFPAAQDALFAEAERTGLRITSGLVVSDRELHPDLEVEPQAAYDVLISPPEGSTLTAVLRHTDSAEGVLGAILALAREESVAEVRVEGDVVFERG